MNKENQAVSQQSSIQLPVFNQVIEIKVEVEDIFNKLLSEFPEEYKHRELVAHAVIGSTKDNGAIGYIYNALNGYSPLIDFTIGEMVECTLEKKNYRYDSNVENEKGEKVMVVDSVQAAKPQWRNRKVAIGKCKVVNINLYQTEKLEVEFEQDNAYGEGKEKITRWVDHKSCTKWADINL